MFAAHSKADVDPLGEISSGHPAPANLRFFAGSPTPGSARRVVMASENLDSKTLPSTRPDWALPNGALDLSEKNLGPAALGGALPPRSRNFVPTLAVRVKGCALI
jgi:hypothetical protein